jgi:uncharacterized membrane protein
MDGMYWLMLVLRVLHILGAVVLVGGVFYLRAVVAPAMPGGATVDDWFAGRRAAWARWVATATTVLLVTGFLNYLHVTQTNEHYQAVFIVKVLLSLVVFFLAAASAGTTRLANRFRQNMRTWLTVCLAAGVLAVALGGVPLPFPWTRKPRNASTC